MPGKWIILAAVASALLVGSLALVDGPGVDAHAGHPQKKLFDTRWYQAVAGDDYEDWMTLSTSAIWYDCGSSFSDCESRWHGPATAAIADWNTQQTTVRFDTLSSQDIFNDFNLYVLDSVFDDPLLLGIALPFDENIDLCLANCTIRYYDVLVSDESHAGPYGTPHDRQSTTAHEIGHVLALMHESVDYPCGVDDTGSIPVSIMSYNCNDPTSVGGQGVNTVQPWDVCGVNHAYHDPTIGYAGCTGSAPPTPAPTAPPSGHQETWGDGDCDGTVGTRDSQALLRKVLQQNPLSQTQPCPLIGTSVTVDGNDRIWGDGDCDVTVGTRDSQALLRKVLQQNPLSQTQPCPNIGQTVSIGGTPPTSTPAPTVPPTPVPTATGQPTLQPTPQPTVQPTPQPTVQPTPQPTPDNSAPLSSVLTIVMPFLFLGDPDYTCLIQSGIFACAATSPTPDYVGVPVAGPALIWSSQTGPDYTCIASLLDCYTEAPGFPDYDCYPFQDIVICESSSIFWPTYGCDFPSSEGAICVTLDESFPDFVCGFAGTVSSGAIVCLRA